MKRLSLVLALVAIAAVGATAHAAGSGSGPGSRANPYRTHMLVKLPEGKGWYLRVNKAIPNGTAAVMAENSFNDPPAAGRQFFLINVTFTYRGSSSAAIFTAGSFAAVGRSNVSYTLGDDSCGVVPAVLDQFKKLFPGGSLSGNLCFSVRRSDAASLEFYYEPLFSLKNTQVFFALR